MYGLHQSPRVFNKSLVLKLSGCGLEKFAADTCVFRLCDSERKDATLNTVGVYVNDLIVTGESKSCKGEKI